MGGKECCIRTREITAIASSGVRATVLHGWGVDLSKFPGLSSCLNFSCVAWFIKDTIAFHKSSKEMEQHALPGASKSVLAAGDRQDQTAIVGYGTVECRNGVLHQDGPFQRLSSGMDRPMKQVSSKHKVARLGRCSVDACEPLATRKCCRCGDAPMLYTTTTNPVSEAWIETSTSA